MPAPHFLTPLLKGRASDYVLAIEPHGAPLATSVEPAFDSKTRNRGLLGRDSLADGAALIIAPSNSVHSFGMRFPIDVIYATRQGRVVKIRRAMPRSRISLAWRAFAVIEMASGAAERAGLEVGDLLAVREADRRPARQ